MKSLKCKLDFHLKRVKKALNGFLSLQLAEVVKDPSIKTSRDSEKTVTARFEARGRGQWWPRKMDQVHFGWSGWRCAAS